METFSDIAAQWPKLSAEVQDGFVKAAEEAGLYSEELATAIGLQEEWNDLQQRDIAQSAAGIYRRNYFIGMIERLAEAQNVLNNMTDAAGYSLRENERTMEALEMKIQSLKTAFTMLAVEIGEAGLLDVMKDAVDTTKEMIEVFGDLPPELKQIIIMLGEMIVIMGVANLTAKTFFSVDLIRKITAYTTATGTATLATKGFGAAIYSIPLWGQIALLTSLGMILHSLVFSEERATQKTRDFIETNTRSAAEAKTNAEEIRKLAQEYTDLANKTNKTAEEENKLKTITQDLVDILPAAIEGFDSAGNAIASIESVSRASRVELEKLNEEMKRSAMMAADAARGQKGTLEEQFKAQQEEMNAIWAAYTSDDPVEAFRKLQGKYGIRMADNLKVNWSLFSWSNEEQMEDAKNALRNWYDEVKEKATQTAIDLAKANAAIDAETKILYGSTTVSSMTGGTTGGVVSGRETPAQAYERLNAERQLLNHQMKIGEVSAAQYLASLRNIEQQMRAAGVEEKKIWSLQEEIYSLAGKDSKGKTLVEHIQERQSYYQHLLRMEQISTQEYIAALEELETELAMVGGSEKELWAIQEEIFTLRAQEAKRAQDEMYSDAMAYYQHETALARMSRDQQIQYLRDLSQQHEWEKEKMWSLEEQIFRLYQDELKSQSEQIDKAYRNRMDRIDEERDAAIEAIQAQIDALDMLEERDDREEAERKHNERIAELEKERRYHELRTGAEHEEALADIKKKIEEEKRSWQKQQEDWSLDDRKMSLRQQIETIRKNAEEEKKIWQQKYDDIKAQWDTFVTEIAQKATTDPRWLEIGRSIGKQIAQGFNEGNVGWQIPNVSSGGGGGSYIDSGSATGTYTNPDGSVVATTGKGYVDTSGYYHPSGGIPGIDNVFDSGGLAVGRGIMMKNILEPERVLSPRLTVSFERLVAALESNQIPQFHDRGVVNNFNAPLFNAEEVAFEDRQDMEIMGRELLRQVRKLM